METIDSFIYESDAHQSNASNASQLWPNSSLAAVNGKRDVLHDTIHDTIHDTLHDLMSLTNRSWEFSGTLDETEYVINITHNSRYNASHNESSVQSITPTSLIDLSVLSGVTTGLNSLNSSVIDSLPWWQSWYRTPYPSGYSQLAIVVLAFFITCIMILIVVGNMLVCIAIATEKSLKPVQNWFIASLAVSDFLLGLVIMPFSLARELMGYWMFGQVWCDVHNALDVLLCTASINNLFMISLDRYWSVTQAVKYLKKRTPSRAALMIAFVWVFSAIVSLPPLVGWKKPDKYNDYPQCELSDDIGYVLYSAIGSFYFPALMMVFVYARIFVAARKRARKNLQKKRLQMPPEVTNDPAKDKSTTTTTCTSLSNPSPPENQNKDEIQSEGGDGGPTAATNATTNATVAVTNTSRASPTDAVVLSNASPTALTPPQIVIEAMAESSDSSQTNDAPQVATSDAHTDACSEVQIQSEPIRMKRSPLKLTIILPDNDRNERIPKQNGSATRSMVTSETRFISGDDDSDTIESPVTKEIAAHDSKSLLSAPKLSKSPYGSTLSIADYDDSDLCIETSDDNKKHKKGNKCRVQYESPMVGRHTPSDAERHKRKIAKARERRATLILGLIMAAFITAWMPFFVLYVLSAVCEQCKQNIATGYFSLAFWLGYCNSAANPIIYTIFNRDFRRAFRKILFK